jgi:hypothetical protein
MQVQERGPGFRQQPFKNSDRPEEALSGSAKETRWDARWEPLQGWSHPRTCGRPPDCSAAPATNPRLSDFPSQSAHASASASARTNDHLYCTVLYRVSTCKCRGTDYNVRECGSWVRIPSRCLALDVAQRSYPGLPVCVGGMKSRPPFSAVSPTIIT